MVITGIGLDVGRILAMMVNLFKPEKILVGSALGTALLGATLNINLQRRLPGINDPVQHLIAHHGHSGPGLAHMAQQVVLSMHGVYLVSSLIAFCALIAVGLVPRGLRPLQEK